MSAEIATITTAAETAAALQKTPPTDLAGLDARTLSAVTEVLRAAAELARAQRPIVLHGPAPYAPAVAPGTAAYGAHVRIPAPPAGGRDETRHETPRAPAPWRPTLWGDRVLWFGSGTAATGVLGALVATAAGAPWVLVLSAVGALLWPIGAAAVNRAERRGGGHDR
jgi:hypothetical protein